MTAASPPWVTKAVSANFPTIQQGVADKSMLPLVDRGSKGTYKLRNVFGCGHFGCVAETGNPDVVFKITSDPAEATFVASSIAMKDETFGVVRYYAITQLLGSLRGRPIWAIWREAAFDVGEVLGYAAKKPSDGYERRSQAEAFRRIMSFKLVGNLLRETIARARSPEETLQKGFDAWKRNRFEIEDVDHLIHGEYDSPGRDGISMARRRYKGFEIVGWCLEALQVVSQMMANEPFAAEVGSALEFYLDRGIVLADVHSGNIGRVNREDYTTPVVVITDPGHMIALPGAKIVVPPAPVV